LIYQSGRVTGPTLEGCNFQSQEKETGMDRFFANGTVNAAQSGLGSGKAPALFLFHSLLSDRASFDAITPKLSRSFRLIVPELPGFGGSKAVSGGLAAVADRMAEAVKEAAGGTETIVLGNGYGGFVALQMAIRHPTLAAKLILADCGAAFSEAGREAFRNMAAASKARGLAAITDVAMRRLFAPEFQAAARPSSKPIPKCCRPPALISPNSTFGRSLRGSRCPSWFWSANTTKRRHRRCRGNWRPACRTRA
jgi:pimeloyl-ACP methyl ester carboxylesterase